METPRNLKVKTVDKLADGIAIEFEDGRCIILRGPVLEAVIPEAEDVTDLPADD